MQLYEGKHPKTKWHESLTEKNSSDKEKLNSKFDLKSGQRHKLLILQFPSFDDAREIKSVWRSIYC